MGGSASKRKGNGYERELVKQAEASGLTAKRAWGSDGRSMGMHEEVDCLISGQKVQAKRRKAIAKFLKPTEHVDVVVFREDGGTSLCLTDWFDWLDQQKEIANLKERVHVLERTIIEQAGGAGSDTEEECDDRKLIRWILRRGEPVTSRDVQSGCRWLRQSGKAERTLNRLVKREKGIWVDSPREQRGHPTRYFVLSPETSGWELTVPQGACQNTNEKVSDEQRKG